MKVPDPGARDTSPKKQLSTLCSRHFPVCISKAVFVNMTGTKPSYASGLLSATQQQHKDSRFTAGIFTHSSCIHLRIQYFRPRAGAAQAVSWKDHSTGSKAKFLAVTACWTQRQRPASNAEYVCLQPLLSTDTYTMLRARKPHS